MSEEKRELKILEIEKKRYFLIDSLKGGINDYHFFANLIDPRDLVILKDGVDENRNYFVFLDNDDEKNYALGLFYDKYQKVN